MGAYRPYRKRHSLFHLLQPSFLQHFHYLSIWIISQLHIFLRHLHQNSLYLLPTTPSMYTSHDFSITQHFTWFICSICHRIHVAGTSSGNPTLLQFIRLFTFINTMLCLCTVLCCSQSGSPNLLFVVGMWARPRDTAHVHLYCDLSCFWILLVPGVGVDGTVSLGLPSQPRNSNPQFYAGCPSCNNPPN